MSTNPRLWRGPITDNQTIVGNQGGGSTAATGQNDYFAVWVDQNNYNGARSTLVARHFDSDGNPLTGEVAVSLFDPVFTAWRPHTQSMADAIPAASEQSAQKPVHEDHRSRIPAAQRRPDDDGADNGDDDK